MSEVSAAELLPLSVRVETALEVLWESAHWFTGVAGWSLWHTISVNYAVFIAMGNNLWNSLIFGGNDRLRV